MFPCLETLLFSIITWMYYFFYLVNDPFGNFLKYKFSLLNDYNIFAQGILFTLLFFTPTD